MNEQARVEFLQARDGVQATQHWAQKTAAIYRAAVLNPDHFAHQCDRRRQFIESYKVLKLYAAQR